MHFLNHVTFGVVHLALRSHRESGYIAIEPGDQLIPRRYYKGDILADFSYQCNIEKQVILLKYRAITANKHPPH